MLLDIWVHSNSQISPLLEELLGNTDQLLQVKTINTILYNNKKEAKTYKRNWKHTCLTIYCNQCFEVIMSTVQYGTYYIDMFMSTVIP